jgi:hypothetical protein
MGIVEDKIIKNHFAAEYIYNKYKNEKTCGVIRSDRTNGTKIVAEPLGVIAGIIPTTNPTSTAIFKSLICLKTRNAIIFSPHPRAKKSTIAAARLIRDFLERLTAPVLAHSGTLDKYTGDGLVAFWGAPLPCPEQADSAVSAALDILQAVAALNQQRHAEQLPPLRVRIGIESGLALVGDLGTTFRSSYTAVGDCINFASRLESAARTLPADIIIGNEAASRITQHTLIPLGSIQLRGTESMMAVFTVGRGHAG